MTCYCATCEKDDPYGEYIIPEGFVFASEAGRLAHPELPELGKMGEEDMYWLSPRGLERLSSYSEGNLIKVKRPAASSRLRIESLRNPPKLRRGERRRVKGA